MLREEGKGKDVVGDAVGISNFESATYFKIKLYIFMLFALTLLSNNSFCQFYVFVRLHIQ